MSRNHVLVYGLDNTQSKIIEKILLSKECFTKVLNQNNLNIQNYFMIIVNNELDPKLKHYINEIEGNLVQIRLCSVNLQPKSNNVKVYNTFEDYLLEVETDIDHSLNQLKQVENRVLNYKKCFDIQRLLLTHKSLSLSEIVKLSGYKSLEVRRYIEVLQWMNEPILYNFENKSWDYQ